MVETSNRQKNRGLKMIHANNTLVVEELIKALEPVIRRIIREELKSVVKKQTDIFHLNPDMPLYDDMVEIKERNKKDELEFISHEEVWRVPIIPVSPPTNQG